MNSRSRLKDQPPTGLRQLAVALLVFGLAAGHAAPARAQSDADLLPLKVKSAFLFNFAKFVTWPEGKMADAAAPIQICVLLPDPFGQILDDTVDGKLVNQRPVTVRRASRASDLRGCHIVYTGEADPGRLSNALSALAGSSTLVVHESAAPMHNGSIRFLIEGRKIRFEINLAETERESLQLSSKLLGLAAIVHE